MKILASLLCFFLATPAYAELKYVPKWSMCGDKACYTFDDAKKLTLIDDRLDELIKANAILMQQVEELKTSNTALNTALALEKLSVTKLKENSDKLSADLLKETARANKAEARPGAFPAWAIAGGIGVAVGVIAGIILGVYVAK